MQKLITALLVLLFTYSAQGQELFTGALQPLSVRHLMRQIDRWEAKGIDTSAEWEYFRPLSPKGYKEGVFRINVRKKSPPDSDDFRIKVLAKRNRIFFYQVAEERCKDYEDSSVCYFHPLEQDTSEKQWQAMNTTFKRFFGVAIDTADLFLQDFPFGYRCDFTASDTHGKEFMDSMTLQRNKAAILQWLHSPNTEKQLFAAFALRKLNKQGVALSRKERKQIRFVLKKRGTIYFCSYCLYGAESSRKITRFYKKFFKNQPKSETAE